MGSKTCRSGQSPCSGCWATSQKRPRAILLENVSNMATKRHRVVLNLVMKVLRDNNYSASWRLLNTRDYYLPQHRSRLYIQAVRLDSLAKMISWPQPIARRPSLALCLDARVGATQEDLNPAKSVIEMLKYARENLKAKGVDYKTTPCCVDVGASKRFSFVQVDLAPAITVARAMGKRLRITH